MAVADGRFRWPWPISMAVAVADSDGRGRFRWPWPISASLQNICEANKRVNRDRANRFRIAGGEAAEVKGSLEAAVAFEYVERGEILAALELADRICAMTYRLAR